MNPKTTVILVVVLALAGMAYLITRDTPADDRNAARPNDVGQSAESILQPDTFGPELVYLALDLDGDVDDIAFSRVQGQWKIDEPHAFPAKNTEIDKVLNTLIDLNGVPIKDNDLPTQPTGLIVVQGKDRYSIWLGKRTGSGKAIVYRQIQNDIQGFITTDALHDLLANLKPNKFYAKSFMPLLMPEIREVHISTPESVAVLHQIDERWWIVYDDKAERALEQRIPERLGLNSYFEHFRRAELLAQHPYQGEQGLAQFGLDKPLITTHFVPMLEDEENADTGWVLRVGVPADPEDKTRFISFGWSEDPTPAVFTIATPYALAFAQDSTAFRDPRVMTTPRAMIASIGLRYSGGPTQTIKLLPGKKPVFHQTNGQTSALSAGLVDEMLKRLVDARSMDFTLADFSEGDILVSIEVTPKLDGRPEKFTVYNDPQIDSDEPTVLVHRGNEPVALRVPRSVVSGLLDPTTLLAEDKE